MNCQNCHMPLDNNARFCRNCGAPVSMPVEPQPPASYPAHQLENAQPTMPWQPPQSPQNVPPQYAAPTQAMQSYESEVPQQPGTFQQPVLEQPITLQQQGSPLQPGTISRDVAGNPSNSGKVAPKRRRGRGCFLGCLVTLLVLVLLITGGWFLLARPYLHNLATTQINDELTTEINQIPSQVTLVPAGIFPVQENTLNNLIVLETAPSDPVQHMQVSITPANMTINFSVYGYGCT
ncbi:MAG TPA: zinc-ribbon domain-containing protein, partial [Ktedonobacteraceae bacterium]|nr:zinc-ribbon domain-containing protein [Ktedonobacteraceae bacterium]